MGNLTVAGYIYILGQRGPDNNWLPFLICSFVFNRTKKLIQV